MKCEFVSFEFVQKIWNEIPNECGKNETVFKCRFSCVEMEKCENEMLAFSTGCLDWIISVC